MKIILCVFQIGKRGGKERDCLAVGRFLAQRGHDVIIATTSPQSETEAPLRLKTLPVSGVSNHARALNFAIATNDYIAAEKPEIVIAFDRIPNADFYYATDAAIALRNSGIRAWLPRHRTYLALERAILQPSSPTRIFFLTERQRDEYAAAYHLDPSRATVLPIILHDERHNAARHHAPRDLTRAQLEIPEGATLAVSVAVKPRQKGVDRTLAALADHRDLYLAVVGSSDGWMMQQARKLKVENRVRVLPYGSNVMDLLFAADFLAHPARNEAAGQVIGEALRAGAGVGDLRLRRRNHEVRRGHRSARTFRSKSLQRSIIGHDRALAADADGSGNGGGAFAGAARTLACGGC